MHKAIGQPKWILVLLKSLGNSPQVSSRSRITCVRAEIKTDTSQVASLEPTSHKDQQHLLDIL